MGRAMALEGRDLLWLQSVLIRLSFEDFPVVLRAGPLETDKSENSENSVQAARLAKK